MSRYGGDQLVAEAVLAAALSAILCSRTGLKCRMRPCAGHAAPSPRAQMVWPSTCFDTSHSASISSGLASPATGESLNKYESIKCLYLY